MSTPTNSLGSSPLGSDHTDDGGNPLFVATPRRAMGSALVGLVGAERLLRLVLDELASMTGRRFDLSATVDELLEAARAAEVSLSGLISDAEDRLARQAVEVCPGCSHKLHAFDVCRCGCDDQVGGRGYNLGCNLPRVEVEAAQR